MKLTTQQFGSEMLNKLGPGKAVDTRNGWGFGGSVFTQWNTQSQDLVVKAGTAYFRHFPSSQFITVTVDGSRVIDLEASPSARGTAYLAVCKAMGHTPSEEYK